MNFSSWRVELNKIFHRNQCQRTKTLMLQQESLRDRWMRPWRSLKSKLWSWIFNNKRVKGLQVLWILIAQSAPVLKNRRWLLMWESPLSLEILKMMLQSKSLKLICLKYLAKISQKQTSHYSQREASQALRQVTKAASNMQVIELWKFLLIQF